jgi:hypothetical protein
VKMKRQRLKGKRANTMSASHSTAALTRVLPDKWCDSDCGSCQSCKDYVFFQQICDELEGNGRIETERENTITDMTLRHGALPSNAADDAAAVGGGSEREWPT